MNATVEISQDQKRIKIAESCGWEITCDDSDNAAGRIYGKRNGGETQIPDYFEDLNGMREAEKVIFDTYDRSAWFRYLIHLENEAMCGGNATHMDHVHATAAQRAEAFGKTLNLW